MRQRRQARRPSLPQLGWAAAGLALAPLASELRLSTPARRLTDEWRNTPLVPRGDTKLGISFRPLQAESLGLDPAATLKELLGYPFEQIRLPAYWNRIEAGPGRFNTAELDRSLDAAEAAGKQIILSLGAIKNFGYPEFFVPRRYLAHALPEHRLVTSQSHPELVTAAQDFLRRIVDRYRDRSAIIAWQVEHEAVDPLGFEHSWRLHSRLVAQEVAAVRAADPSRPILMNGFLPTSTAVGWMQRLRTHDQGDSLAVARDLADIVGLDVYPRHAVLGTLGLSLYLDGALSPWRARSWRRIGEWTDRSARSVMIAEGQAEPWEAVTVPPNPLGMAAYSCPPERVISNYNFCMGRSAGLLRLRAYLFWGCEYWVLRRATGDDSYLGAFARVLEQA